MLQKALLTSPGTSPYVSIQRHFLHISIYIYMHMHIWYSFSQMRPFYIHSSVPCFFFLSIMYLRYLSTSAHWAPFLFLLMTVDWGFLQSFSISPLLFQLSVFCCVELCFSTFPSICVFTHTHPSYISTSIFVRYENLYCPSFQS